MMKIMKDKEIALVKEILKKLGASEEDQELVAEATIDADLKGFTSHGLGRFPQYLISIKSGTINLEDNITIEKETPAIALINGNSGFGQAVSYKAGVFYLSKARQSAHRNPPRRAGSLPLLDSSGASKGIAEHPSGLWAHCRRM